MLTADRFLRSGKVRDLYALDDERLLLVASDRISAFDVVLPTDIPDKGRVLTGLSRWWFEQTANIVPNHLLGVVADDPNLRGRSMVCRRAIVLPIEIVVRGYLSGSGWKEYASTGTVCGVRLPPGLRESDRLPEPIFTPATKATSGHDINISEAEAGRLVGSDLLRQLREHTLALYEHGVRHAESRGIILADTKFEFGRLPSGELILIDEVMTPDSSRYWPRDQYAAGGATTKLRQTVRARLSRADPLEQAAACSFTAGGCRPPDSR